MSFRRGGAMKILSIVGLLVMLAPVGALARVPMRAEGNAFLASWAHAFLSSLGSLLSPSWFGVRTGDSGPAGGSALKEERGMGSDPWGRPVAPGGSGSNPVPTGVEPPGTSPGESP